MTQEEKKLLLKDLCGRFPYGVMMKVTPEGGGPGGVESYDIKLNIELLDVFSDFADAFKPYLRPMSSMTREEKGEYFLITERFYDVYTTNDTPAYTGERMVFVDDIEELIDFYNSHHFDFRGLIEKGLALEAPEGMYKKD